MTIDTFNIDQFDKFMEGLQRPYAKLGNIGGEFCYLIFLDDKLGIYIRSSIDRSGYSAMIGEDSIRAYLVEYNHIPSIIPTPIYRTRILGKVSQWTTRLPGWQNRLKNIIRDLYNWNGVANYCPECNVPLSFFKVKKDGANKNRIFASCSNSNHRKVFIWVTERKIK